MKIFLTLAKNRKNLKESRNNKKKSSKNLKIGVFIIFISTIISFLLMFSFNSLN